MVLEKEREKGEVKEINTTVKWAVFKALRR